MVAYTKPRQRKQEVSEQLRGERDKIKFIDLKDGKLYDLRKQEGKTFHKLHDSYERVLDAN